MIPINREQEQCAAPCDVSDQVCSAYLADVSRKTILLLFQDKTRVCGGTGGFLRESNTLLPGYATVSKVDSLTHFFLIIFFHEIQLVQ